MAWKRRDSRGRRAGPEAFGPYVFEALEPRLLLSADPLGTAIGGVPAMDPLEDQVSGESSDLDVLLQAPTARLAAGDAVGRDSSHGSTPPVDLVDLAHLSSFGSSPEALAPREIVFVDARTPDYQQLLAELQDGSDGRAFEVVVLDADRNGIGQIGDVLAQRSDINAVHIVSHGTDRGVQLGGSWLTQESLAAYGEDIAGWGGALTDEADLLIYGCDLAGSEEGRALVERLSALTGADVAASDDLTGHTSLGGDWDLEYAAGTVESAVAVSAAAQQDWSGLLATVNVTTTVDELNGTVTSIADLQGTPGGAGVSLREAVIAANNTPGADTIMLPGGTYVLDIGGGGPDENHGDLDIDDVVTIIGDGAKSTVIDGNLNDRILHLTFGAGGSALSGVTLQNGDPGTADGGAILSQVSLSITDAEITGNTGKNGGAIMANDTLTLDRVTVAGNTAVNGGGVLLNSGSDHSLTNVTISGNTATTSAGGGLLAKGTTTLTNVTISGNSAFTVGGGIYNDGTTITVSNTIIANNTAGGGGNDAFGAFTSDASNIIEDATDATGFGGDDVGTDPMLLALGDYGGEIRTHQPDTGSIAINGGTGIGAPAVDGRGFLRGDGSIDVGAHEVGASAASTAHYLDQFNAVSYSGDDGTLSWTNDWQEIGESDGPDMGRVLAYNNSDFGERGLEIWKAVRGAWREADLSGAASATLSLDWGLLWTEAGDSVTLEISTDGGANWALIGTFAGPASHTVLQHASYNISGHIDSDTRIKFESTTFGDNDEFLVDNVRIELSGTPPVNNPPTFSALDGAPTFVEDGPAVVLDADVDISDTELDALNSGLGNYVGASLTLLRNSGAAAEDVFAFNDGNGITFSSGNLIKNAQIIASFDTTTTPGELVVSFTDANGEIPTSADVDNILRQITYANSSDAPPASVQIDWTFDDGDAGGSLTASGSTTLAITAVNDAPTLDLDANNSIMPGNDYALTYTEGDAATAIADVDTDLADVDSTAFDNVKLAITGLLDGNAEEIVLDGTTFQLATNVVGQNTTGALYTVTVSTAVGSADLTITRQGGGSFSEAEAETLIKAIAYHHADGANPSNGDRLIDVTVNDGTADSLAARTTVNVNPVNAAPLINDATTAVAEDAANTTLVDDLDDANTGNDTDADGQALSYSITAGNTDGIFAIDSATGQITVLDNTNLDYEATNQYVLTVEATDGSNTDTAAITIDITNVNDNAPDITSAATASVVENNTAVITVTATDQDLPPDTLTYSLVGGADQAFFSIDAGTGALSFLAPPDFESPADAGTDNVYEVQVQVDDGSGGTDIQTVTVTVTDSTVLDQFNAVGYSGNDGPRDWTTDWQEIGEAQNPTGGSVRVVPGRLRIGGDEVNINGRGIFREADFAGASSATLSFTYQRQLLDESGGSVTVSISPDGGTSWTPLRTYNLVGTDAAPLTESIDVSGFVSGNMQVRFLGSGSDVESHFYVDDVQIHDGATPNNAPVITSDGGGVVAGVNVAENTSGVTTVTANDIDADIPTYGISGGADQALFTIDPASGALSFLAPPDFETPTDAGADNIYEVEVMASDGKGGVDTQLISVTVTNTNDAPQTNTASASGPEDAASIAITLGGSDVDGTVASFSLGSLPANGTLYTDVGLSTMAATGTDYAATGEALTLYFVPDAGWNGVTGFQFAAKDDLGLADATPATATLTVTAANDAPQTSAASASGPEDAASIAITLGGSDVDGTVASFSLGSLPANGTLYTDVGLTTMAATGTDYAATGEALTLYFVPAADWNGVTSFQFAAKDDLGQADPTPAMATITVTPVNDAPMGIGLSNVDVDENIDTTGGYSVGILSASDPDSGDTLTYSIVGGADMAKFSIGGTGSNELIVSDGVLDFETQGTYQVVVRVTDAGGLTYDATRTIGVNDLNETSPAPEPLPPEVVEPLAPEPPPSVPEPLFPADNVDVTSPEEGSEASSSQEDSESHGNGSGTGTGSSEVQDSEEADLSLPPFDDLQGQPIETGDGPPAAKEVLTGTVESVMKAYSIAHPVVGPALRHLGELAGMGEDRPAFYDPVSLVETGGFLHELDSVRDDIADDLRFDKTVVGTTIVASTGLSVGYVVWLVRGGALLTSLLSSLPAWRLVDPLPILAYVADRPEDDQDEEETLESLVKERPRRAETGDGEHSRD